MRSELHTPTESAGSKIPFVDLPAQIRSLQPELDQRVQEIISSCSFIQGPAVERFNKNFLKIHGGAFGVGCSNGTSAITVALRALDIGPGDEVLIPNHTFFGTAEPVVEVGATPVLIEIDTEYRQIDWTAAAAKVTAHTKAVIPVHLYGLPEPMDQVMAFARQHGLRVIEDCAQAHTARWNGRPVGTFGDVATFSFFPAKNLGAFGDAGYILTQNAELFDFIARYIDHGRQEKYVHEFFGGNFRLDALQAAILDVKLGKLLVWSERRRELATIYNELLAGFQVLKPRALATPVYHLFVVEVSNRQAVMEHLQSQGIGCGIHYPVTLNQQPAFKAYGYKSGQFPISERMVERILSLPFFPEMTLNQVERVATEFLRVAKP